jgi:thioredoxin 1
LAGWALTALGGETCQNSAHPTREKLTGAFLQGSQGRIKRSTSFNKTQHSRRTMASADVFNIGDGDFQKEVLDSLQPVLVDFWATWCAPCRAIAPAVEELATQYKGRVKVVKVNIDEHQQTPQQYGVRSIPMLFVFKGGVVVEQIVGAVPKARLEEALKKVV